MRDRSTLYPIGALRVGIDPHWLRLVLGVIILLAFGVRLAFRG